MIEIDGSHEEGGGQILRTALALSTVTGKPFIIRSIRSKRPQPGLKPQHVMAIRAMEILTGARFKGADVASTEVEFWPGTLKPGDFSIDIGTAGSITLLLQALMLPVVASKQDVSLKITGGTDVEWSQPWDHFNTILRPFIQGRLDANLVRRGYYPMGGGIVELAFSEKPSYEHLILKERGKIDFITGVSHASCSLAKGKVAERQAESCKHHLSNLGVPIEIEVSYSDSLSPGSGIFIAAHYGTNIIGSSALGRIGKRAEAVGDEAARGLLEELKSGAPLDSYTGDQLLQFLRPGDVIQVPEITGHIKSGLYVSELFLGKTLAVEGKLIRAL